MAEGSMDRDKGSEEKDAFSRNTEIRLGISHTRRLLADIVGKSPMPDQCSVLGTLSRTRYRAAAAVSYRAVPVEAIGDHAFCAGS